MRGVHAKTAAGFALRLLSARAIWGVPMNLDSGDREAGVTKELRAKLLAVKHRGGRMVGGAAGSDAKRASRTVDSEDGHWQLGLILAVQRRLHRTHEDCIVHARAEHIRGGAAKEDNVQVLRTAAAHLSDSKVTDRSTKETRSMLCGCYGLAFVRERPEAVQRGENRVNQILVSH